MIYAMIKDNSVVNRIVIADEDAALADTLVASGICDACLRVDNLDPEPQIGWTYENETFSPPVSQ